MLKQEKVNNIDKKEVEGTDKKQILYKRTVVTSCFLCESTKFFLPSQVRHVLDAHSAPLPAILEIPSKDRYVLP